MIDLSKPLKTRDGRLVGIWEVHDDMIAGCIADGTGGFQACLWDKFDGYRLDHMDSNNDDLVNELPRYDDEHIEHWGSIYIDRRLNDLGILFETFLAYPHEILEALGTTDYEPLLPKQREVMMDLLTEEMLILEADLLPEDAIRQGMHYIEPLRRHAYDLSHDRACNLKMRKQ